MEIKSKNLEELEVVCSDIRNRIIDVVSRKGGHFSSTLGAVELTVAMHKVFDVEKVIHLFMMFHINVILISL